MPDETGEHASEPLAQGKPGIEEPRRGYSAGTLFWISLGVGLVVVVLLLVPRLRMLGEPPRSSCKNNLRQIGIALHLYADENGDAFPPDLARLYPTYTDNVKIFSCPSSPSSYTDFLPGGAVTEKSSGYTYIPGLHTTMPGAFVVAYDKSLLNHKKQGLNFLCIDSGVEWRRVASKEQEAEFQRRLALQAEAVEKWRTSGKPVEAFGEFISPELRELMGR